MEALVPDVYAMVEDVKTEQVELSTELAKRGEVVEIFQRPGWIVIEEYITGAIECVRNYDIGNDSMEMIGFKEMASRIASTALKGILVIKDLALLDVEQIGKEK
jgi:hypothetical protein